MKALLVALAAVALAALAYGWCQGRNADAWERQAQDATTAADSLRAAADSFHLLYVADSARADSLARDAEGVTPSHTRVVRLREVVAMADSSLVGVVDSLDAAVRGWEAAYHASMEANASLVVANSLLRQEADTLRTTLAARPKPPPSLDLGILRIELLPTLGVGGFVGAGLDGRGVAGGGVTLSWKVRPG